MERTTMGAKSSKQVLLGITVLGVLSLLAVLWSHASLLDRSVGGAFRTSGVVGALPSLGLFGGATQNLGTYDEEPMFVDGYPLFSGPKRFWESRLYIWGARITTSYESSDLVFFDFWSQGFLELARKRVVVDGMPNLTNAILSREAAEQTVFISTLASNRKYHCAYTPNNNLDMHAGHGFYRFRCNITGDPSLNLPIALFKVSALVQINETSDEIPVVAFNISRMKDSVGLVGPENELGIPFINQPVVDLTLCVGGISNKGAPYLPEFLQHHIRMGVGQFVIGIHEPVWTPSFNQIHRVLLPLIRAGIAFLYPMPQPSDVLWLDRDTLKVLFYEGCLFHAKGRSQYVGNWDIDEFWMPSVSNESQESKSIVQVLNTFEAAPDSPCKDWCWLSFPSHSIWRISTTRKFGDQQRIAEAFKHRTDQIQHTMIGFNYIWQKSIARTKNVFNSGFHVFGSCLINGNYSQGFHAAHHSAAKKCSIRVPNLGIMHHYLGIFYNHPIHERDFNVPAHVRDEYSLLIEKLGYAVTATSPITGQTFVYNRVTGQKPEPPYDIV